MEESPEATENELDDGTKERRRPWKRSITLFDQNSRRQPHSISLLGFPSFALSLILPNPSLHHDSRRRWKKAKDDFHEMMSYWQENLQR